MGFAIRRRVGKGAINAHRTCYAYGVPTRSCSLASARFAWARCCAVRVATPALVDRTFAHPTSTVNQSRWRDMETIGFVGVGKIGLPISENLIKSGYRVIGYRRSSLAEFEKIGGVPARS